MATSTATQLTDSVSPNLMSTPRTAMVASGGSPTELDAIALLKAELDTLGVLLSECECARTLAAMKERVDEICVAFRVHTQVAEEIFYPHVMAALPARWRQRQTGGDQTIAKRLVQQLENAEPRDASYDSRVTVLSGLIAQHIRQMKVEDLPIATASSLDMASLGARMAQRKSDLLACRGPSHVGSARQGPT